MPDKPRRIYWDACVFLHYIEGTPDWMPILDSLLEEARDAGRLTIVTSTLSIAEVAFAKAEKDGRELDPAIEAMIDAFWQDRSAIRLIEFNELVARKARGLMRRSRAEDRHLKTIDAIHLASAQLLKVEAFHTMEKRLRAAWGDLEFPVQEPFTPRPKLFT